MSSITNSSEIINISSLELRGRATKDESFSQIEFEIDKYQCQPRRSLSLFSS